MKMRVPFEKRSAGLRYFHRQAAIYRARGLTTHGKQRRRRQTPRTLWERREMARDRALKSWARLSVSRITDGLTTRGGQRVLRLKYFDSFILAAEIEAAADALEKFFNQLPTPAQAPCVQLAATLAALRRRLPKANQPGGSR